MACHKPSLIAVLESHISGRRADDVIKKLSVLHSHRVKVNGFLGGIWLLWNKEWSVTILENDKQYIHASVVENGSLLMHFTAVYGSPSLMHRRRLWQKLHRICDQSQVPWLAAGDYNALLTADEKRGGAMHRSSIDKDFVQWFEANDVIDHGFRGPKFTWQRRCLFGRLDRALCNEDLCLRFKEASVFHLPRLYSDHRPILVQLNMLGASHTSDRPFKFQAAWMTHELFGQFMLDKWSRSSDLMSSLGGLTVDLKDWNFHVFGNVYKQKRQLIARIDGIQHYLENRQSHFLQKLEMQLRRELDTIRYREELIWFQKSQAD
ncbi:uncharacterized protein LOC131179409 [Hevea brasiliensis]|nr:uncharacterized protein LOC131179409 [Hevea brasiliensis]